MQNDTRDNPCPDPPEHDIAHHRGAEVVSRTEVRGEPQSGVTLAPELPSNTRTHSPEFNKEPVLIYNLEPESRSQASPKLLLNRGFRKPPNYRGSAPAKLWRPSIEDPLRDIAGATRGPNRLPPRRLVTFGRRRVVKKGSRR